MLTRKFNLISVEKFKFMLLLLRAPKLSSIKMCVLEQATFSVSKDTELVESPWVG